MTGLYEWNPIPHRVTVKCPKCQGPAEFDFAEVQRIHLRRDIPHFQAHKAFEYKQFSDSCGQVWHAAVFYPGLHGPMPTSLHNPPEGYPAEAWSHPRYWRGSPGLGMAVSVATFAVTSLSID